MAIHHPILRVFILLFIVACGCNDEKPLQKIELAEEASLLKVSVHSFDRDLFDGDFSQPKKVADSLRSHYGDFFCGFVEDDIRIAACTSDSVGLLLNTFVNDPHIAETHRAVMTTFTDDKREAITADLQESVRRWHHFFPDSIIPGIIFYQSAWNRSIATTDSVIGIALDCYLGPDHAITQKLSPDFFPQYMKNNMDERYIQADAVKGFAAWKARGYYQPKDLLSELIFYGKVMYLAEALAPDISDSLMMSWSSEQWLWAKGAEKEIWKTIANEKVMYRSKPFEINKWFADGPFTSAAGVPQESAPQLGAWIGWNIVRQYMKRNPDVSLQSMLTERDLQKILAAYVPGKS
jgi:hypothetical protein